MRKRNGLSSNPWAVSLVSAVAALGVAMPILGRGASAGELVAGIVAGLLAAVVGGGLVARPAFRALRRWQQSGDELAARLLEATPDDAADLTDHDVRLEAFGGLRREEDRLEESLSELAAALQDEDRLRHRRQELHEPVGVALRKGRDLSSSKRDETPGLRRMSTLIEDFGSGVRTAQDACDGVLQSSIAFGEVSSLFSQNAKTGRESCVRAGHGADELESQMDAVGTLVRRLEARSREIGQVLLVLNDITEQTNLLALNAAIIAAQAGEHGKGFGVVADEMRNLSERASSSTKETEILAKSLQDEVTKAVQSMGDAGAIAKKVRLAVGETSEITTVLAELGRKNVDTAKAAVGAAESQSSGVRDLSSRLRQIHEECERFDRFQEEVVLPTRSVLAEVTALLEAQWQMGAVRESLRTRLEGAMSAIRDKRLQEGRDRAELERWTEELRQAGREWVAALREERRRSNVVRDVANEIRVLR
jgi:methyl-accepting chemotaxis protein